MSLIMAMLAMAAAPSAPYSFKDYALGSNILDLRTRAFDRGKYGDRRFKCSDSDADIYLRPLPEEQRVGVVRCHLFEKIGPSEVFTDIPLNEDFGARVAFSYYRSSLYKIEVTADVAATQVIIDSLTAKFGKPSLVDNGEMQVRSGAKFPRVTEIWTNAFGSIALESPSSTTETVSVIYSDTKASKDVDQARAAETDLKTVM